MRKLIPVYLIIFLAGATSLFAHDITDKEIMGVGDYLELRFWPDMITVDYWIGIGEVVALGYRTDLDTNQDGTISEEEQNNYLASLTKEVTVGKFSVELNGEKLPFQLVWSKMDLLSERGVKPVRMKVNFPFLYKTTPLIDTWQTVTFSTRNVLGRSVVLKIFVATQPGVEVRYEPSDEKYVQLLNRGVDFVSDEQTKFTVSYRVRSAGNVTSSKEAENFFSQSQWTANSGGTDKTKEALIKFLSIQDVNLGIIIISLVISFLYGCAHALAPGHGKTIVAGYLVGSKGTPWDAVFLGLAVTLTHVSVVVAVGIIALVASHLVNSTTLTNILSLGSSSLIVVVGLFMLIKRIRGFFSGGIPHYHHHDHNHEHTHSDNHATSHSGISLSTLLPLGISGGLLPCPAAIVVLLMAISINRIIWGLVIILAFSLGLASILIIIGLLMVTGNRLLNKITPAPTVIRILSLVGPVVIMVIGVIMLIKVLFPTI